MFNGNTTNGNMRNVEFDRMSFCGSISGETYASWRKQHTCTLRDHCSDAGSIGGASFSKQTKLNRWLHRHLQQVDRNGLDYPAAPAAAVPKSSNGRFNTVFHHYRFIVVMLGGLSFGCMMLLRFNISVAILTMVNQTALYMHENPNKNLDDFLNEGYQLSSAAGGGQFDWDNEIQNMIMSWYMIAYTLPQLATTKLGLLIGSRLATPISLSICALATLLTPSLAEWGGWQWVVGLRLLNGFGASAVLPMMLNLIEHWMPYEDISLGLTLAQVLQAALTAASPFVAGELAAIHWSYAFYVPALGALIFCSLWLLLVTDRPDDNWLISSQELDTICGCSQVEAAAATAAAAAALAKELEGAAPSCQQQQQHSQHDHQGRANFMDIFKVPSLYAYILVLTLHCSSYNGFAFVLPAYLRQFLKIEVSENGAYCSLIQAGSIVAVLWPHPCLHLLGSRFGLSLTAARRIIYGLGCSVAAATWIYVGAFHEFQLPLLFLNRCFQGCADVIITGSLMGNYSSAGLSSMAFSLVNTIGNLSVVFTSTFIGWLLDESGQSRTGWLWIMALLGFAQLLTLTLFATAIRSEPIQFDNHHRLMQPTDAANHIEKSANCNSDEEPAQIKIICKVV